MVLNAVRGFLARVAGERGLALALDDLQWADAATLRLLKHLADGPVLIVGTAREDGLDPGHPPPAPASGWFASTRNRRSASSR